MVQQLMERWERAFDEIELLSVYRNAAKMFKYAAGGPCFDWSNYTSENFSSERPLTDTKIWAEWMKPTGPGRSYYCQSQQEQKKKRPGIPDGRYNFCF